MVEQTVDIVAIGSLWGSRHSKEELGFKIIKNLFIRGGSRPVNLIDNDVVKGVSLKTVEDIIFREGLNHGKEVATSPIQTPLSC